MPSISHQSDDQLELYALSRLTSVENSAIEEHLLICQACRERCEEISNFALAMREALRRVPVEQEVQWFGWLRSGFVLAGAFAALVLAVVVYLNTGRAALAPIATIQLTALRGSDVQTVKPAKKLEILLSDAGGVTRADLVRGDGSTVWSGPASQKLEIEKTLPAGDYFLRSYSAAGQLLHEYAFQVQR